MSKYLYGGALLLTLAITITSCGKSANNTNFYEKESVKTSEEKDMWASDADLIKAIKGQADEYVAILSLEDYLYDNAKLSDDVVTALIAEQRVPDYVVETALVLSAPLSANNLSSLSVKRPSMSTTAITAANSIPYTVGFAIINTAHRTIIFGNNIVKTMKPGSDDCNCGEGVITVGSNYTGITLTTTVTVANPSDPNQMKPCSSDNPKWTCGDVVYADLTSTDGSSANYNIQCRQSTAKCFKNPRSARRDY